MKRLFTLFWVFFVIYSLSAHNSCDQCSFITFKENKGQWNDHIKYKAELSAASVFYERKCITFDLYSDEDVLSIFGGKNHVLRHSPLKSDVIRHHAFKMHFINANPNVVINPDQKIGTYYNYFIGNDKSKWKSKINAFYKLTYENLWRNIDLIYYSENGNLKYDVVLKPGSQISEVLFKYEGLDQISIQNGTLILDNTIHKIVEQRPYAYQLINGEKKEVSCEFTLDNQTRKVGFRLIGNYNINYDVVIDPTLIFSSYSGSTADNFGYTATFDKDGNAYEGGSVFSPGQYPITLGAFQQSWGGGSGAGNLSGVDMGIQKFSADGSSILYATYIGGVSDELPHSMIVNANNELFILGTSSSPNYPVSSGVFDSTFNGGLNTGAFGGLGVHYENGSDIVITRLSEDGTQLLASTFMGGTGNDGLNISAALKRNYADEIRGEIDVDEFSNIYVATTTRSVDFPRTFNTFQNFFAGAADACVFKMDQSLTTLLWSTTYGGPLDDAAYSICQDNSGNIFFTGGTASNTLFMTPGSIQTTNAGGSCDGFIAHMTPDGQNMLHSTYYGHGDYNQLYFVETNKADEVFVFGQANNSGSNYIFNSLYNVPDGGMVVSKFSNDLTSVIWSTSFGSHPGVPDISPTAFLVDVCSKVYISGWGGAVNGFGGTSGLPVTPDGHQLTTTNSDFYLMVLEDDASAVSYATYFGGANGAEHVDGGTSRFDKGGVIYQSVCSSCGGTFDFPTSSGSAYPNNLNTTNGNRCSNAIFKFDFNLPICLAEFDVPAGCVPYNAFFNNSSHVNGNSPIFNWDFGDGSSSTDSLPNHLYTSPGLYTVTLIVTDISSCNTRDTAQLQVLVLADTNVILQPLDICPGDNVQIGFPPSSNSSLTYSWSPSSGLSATDISNPFASPTTTTTYLCQVSNSICIDTFFQTVNVFNNSPNIIGPNPICPIDTVLINLFNSSPSIYSYNWSPSSEILSGNGTTQILVSPNITTEYFVSVTNSIGCLYTDSFTLVVLPEQQVNAEFSYPNSACSDIIANFVSQINGIGPYYIQWDFGEGTTSSLSNPSHAFTIPGVYNIQLVVVDTGGCRTKDTVLHQIFILSDTSGTLPDAYICPGDSVQIGFTSVSDPTLTFNWLPISFLSNSNIPAPLAFPNINTQYTCLVSNGICTDTFYQNVLQFLNSIQINPVDSICAQDTISLQVTNTFSAPYAYSWNPVNQILSGANTSNPLVSPDNSTSYSVTVTSIDWGCSYVSSVLVPVKPFIQVVADFLVNDGCKPYNATINNLTSTSGNASFQWTFSDGGNSSLQNPTHLFNQSGYFNITLVVSDSGSCFSKDTLTKTIYVIKDTLVFLTPDTICLGDTTSIGILPYGPSSLTYQWTPANFISNPNAAATFAFPSQTTTYHLQVSNSLCADDYYQPIVVLNDTIFIIGHPVACASDTVHLVAENTGLQILNYYWFPQQNIISGVNSQTAVVTVPSDMIFNVNASHPQFGCTYESSIFIDVLSTLNDIQVSASPTSIPIGDSTQLNTVADASVVSLIWNFDSTLSSLNIPNPLAFPNQPTTYYVTAVDSFGCYKTDSVTVFILYTPCGEESIFIPNAFTPNNDGKNDVFRIRGNNILKARLIVYDRWGEKMFETNDIYQGWDGTFKGKKLDPSVFGYYVEGTCDTGFDFVIKGNVTLFR